MNDASDYDFDGFAAWDGSVYNEEPPFMHTLLARGDDIAIVSLNDVIFSLRRCKGMTDAREIG